ncbi:unnamed protein product [Rhizophagus irregularis]|nr:unnamed protein product [Rhizophagus irregularis]
MHASAINHFWVHEEYLVLHPFSFQETLSKCHFWGYITITLPSPDTFEHILQYLYDGDADKWYDTLTPENYFREIKKKNLNDDDDDDDDEEMIDDDMMDDDDEEECIR